MVGGAGGRDAEILTSRVLDQYEHHYHLLVSILKGIVLYAASTSILAIYASDQPAIVRTVATMYWVAGMVSMVANYDGIMVGSLIITRPPNMIDVVMPFLLGVAEFSHFAVLAPLPDDPVTGPLSTAEQLSHLAWWPFIFGVFTLIACIEISASRRGSLAEAERMGPDMAELNRWYANSLTGGQRFTAISSTMLLLAFFALRSDLPDPFPTLDTLRRWQGVLAVIVTFGSVAGLVASEQARRRIMATVAESPTGG